MFARVKKSGKYQYLQIVENRKEKGKVKQRVISTVGRMDQLHARGRVETLIKSLSRFSERTMLVLSGNSEVLADAKKIGPALIFERLWQRTGIRDAINKALAGRAYEFDVERAIFLTVLHRLMVSGSDRFCDRWHRDYIIDGVEHLELHHLYRSMAFLGTELSDQSKASRFSPRCVKDLIEDELFFCRRDLFAELDLVFFDTTSLYFEGNGGAALGRRGHNKDHRPNLKQMVISVILDNHGQPICCEMWPGNTTDVTTLVPVVEQIKKRFSIRSFCIVADRGMISADTIEQLESDENKMLYILGARMRKVKAIREQVLSRPGRYSQVREEGKAAKDPSPLKVKQVDLDGQRYILCVNPRQARKDARDRDTIVAALTDQIKQGPKSLVGNKGYRKYVKIAKDSVHIDEEKIKSEARFDGKWVLRTNTDLSAAQVALKYKELWRVERVFRDVKSLIDTRPVFHRHDRTIRGHVFCSFLALILRKELDRHLDAAGHQFEWAEIKQDLKALQTVTVTENDKQLAVRTQAVGVCGKVFQAVGVALPSTIREV
jgi:transposase